MSHCIYRFDIYNGTKLKKKLYKYKDSERIWSRYLCHSVYVNLIYLTGPTRTLQTQSYMRTQVHSYIYVQQIYKTTMYLIMKTHLGGVNSTRLTGFRYNQLRMLRISQNFQNNSRCRTYILI